MSEAAIADTPEIKTPAPSGDAGDVTPADAASVPPPAEPAAPSDADIEAEAQAALTARLETQGKESGTVTPEPPRPRVDPALETEARRLHTEGYRTRQQKVDAYDADLAEEVSEPLRKRLVKEFKDFLNEEHADGIKYGGFTSKALALQEEQQEIMTGLQSALPAAARPEWESAFTEATTKNGGVMPYAEVFKTYWDLAEAAGRDKGYKAGHTDGFKDGRRVGEKTKASAESGQSVNGVVESQNGPITLEEALTLPVSELRKRQERVGV